MLKASRSFVYDTFDCHERKQGYDKPDSDRLFHKFDDNKDGLRIE